MAAALGLSLDDETAAGEYKLKAFLLMIRKQKGLRFSAPTG